MLDEALKNEVGTSQIDELEKSSRYYRAAGNNIALIPTDTSDASVKKALNSQMFRNHPGIEAVGFVSQEPESKYLELMMAWRNFSGNTSLAATSFFLEGRDGDVDFKVSGVSSIVHGKIEDSKVSIELPLVGSRCLSTEDDKVSILSIEGITHLMVEDDRQDISPQQYVSEGDKLIEKYRAAIPNSHSILGVNFITRRDDGSIMLHPMNQVTDLGVSEYENACGSAALCLALYEHTNGRLASGIQVLQPSGDVITASIKTGNDGCLLGSIEDSVREVWESIK